jgi:hypothetical protein
VVALGDLSREDLASTAEAVVMDDEGYGLRLLDRRPLDRVGGTFKMDVGSLGADFDGRMVGGILTNIQAGFFPTQRFGLVANLTLSGGSDPQGQTFTRHALSIEPQFFPRQARPRPPRPLRRPGQAARDSGGAAAAQRNGARRWPARGGRDDDAHGSHAAGRVDEHVSRDGALDGDGDGGARYCGLLNLNGF